MLNIAKRIFVGWDITKNKDILPEVEVLPVGNSSNEKKKIESMMKPNIGFYEYDNIPLPGFVLFDTNVRSWSSTDFWVVIDPRGFLVRITNNNLQQLMYDSGITKGLIQERCVWMRDDSETKMTLVPISSPKYQEALKNTELLDNRKNIKDIQIGDTVMIQNGLQGIFRGTLSLYGTLFSYSDNSVYKPQVYLRRQILEVYPGRYYYNQDIKILKIVHRASKGLTREESADIINNQILSGNTYFTTTPRINGKYYGCHGLIKYVSVDAVPKPTISLDEITKQDAIDIFIGAFAFRDMGQLVLEKANKLFLVYYGSYYNISPISTNSFYVSEIKTTTNNNIILNDSPNRLPRLDLQRTYNIDEFSKFYRVIKHIKNNTYI